MTPEREISYVEVEIGKIFIQQCFQGTNIVKRLAYIQVRSGFIACDFFLDPECIGQGSISRSHDP